MDIRQKRNKVQSVSGKRRAGYVRMPINYTQMFYNSKATDQRDLRARLTKIIFKAAKDESLTLSEFNKVLIECLNRIKQHEQSR